MRKALDLLQMFSFLLRKLNENAFSSAYCSNTMKWKSHRKHKIVFLNSSMKSTPCLVFCSGFQCGFSMCESTSRGWKLMKYVNAHMKSYDTTRSSHLCVFANYCTKENVSLLIQGHHDQCYKYPALEICTV